MEIVKHDGYYTYGGVVVRKHEVTGIKTLGYAYAIIMVNKSGRLFRDWQPCRLNRAENLINNDIRFRGGEIRNGEIWLQEAIKKTQTL
jgi:hypothetical protein